MLMAREISVTTRVSGKCVSPKIRSHVLRHDLVFIMKVKVVTPRPWKLVAHQRLLSILIDLGRRVQDLSEALANAVDPDRFGLDPGPSCNVLHNQPHALPSKVRQRAAGPLGYEYRIR